MACSAQRPHRPHRPHSAPPGGRPGTRSSRRPGAAASTVPVGDRLGEGVPGRGRRITARFELPAHRDAVTVARHVVRAMAPVLDRETLGRGELVVSELVTNAVRHGSSRPGSVVELTLLLADGQLSGQVCSAGPPFVLPSAPPPTGRAGGYGLHIVQQVAKVDVDRRGDGNVVGFSVGPAVRP